MRSCTAPGRAVATFDKLGVIVEKLLGINSPFNLSRYLGRITNWCLVVIGLVIEVMGDVRDDVPCALNLSKRISGRRRVAAFEEPQRSIVSIAEGLGNRN